MRNPSDTYPTMEVGNASADLEHETSVSQNCGGPTLLLMRARGHPRG
ncbi:MAG: hypothetical protein CM15mP18_0150 [Methanobacteriota archaeon]|nr:MAG: hypothetical protein CM15mP18_0150 [Euryarchaeota archaeon]